MGNHDYWIKVTTEGSIDAGIAAPIVESTEVLLRWTVGCGAGSLTLDEGNYPNSSLGDK